MHVRHEQPDAREQQDHAGPAHRQHREAEQRRDQRDEPERAGEDDAGMKDLVADPGQAREEQQRQDVRVDQRVQQSGEEAGVHVVDLGAGEMQHVAPGLRLHPVRLL